MNPVFKYEKKMEWWEKPSIIYAFNHPYVRSRLEKLMGSNLVNLTERPYMERLKERILEDYENCMNKRIKQREEEEIERVKNLVLVGKIPIHKAPIEMSNHPIMIIERYCDKLIAAHRAKIKVPKPHIPQHLYWDDTPDPPSGLSIENGHIFRPGNDRLCTPPDVLLAVGDDVELERGYMLPKDEYERNRYESDAVKELKGTLSVDEMYAIADEIIYGIDRNLVLYPDAPTDGNQIAVESHESLLDQRVNFN